MSIEERGALSIKEAATYTSLSRTMIFQLIRAGRLQTIKVGRRRLVKMDSLRILLRGAD